MCNDDGPYIKGYRNKNGQMDLAWSKEKKNEEKPNHQYGTREYLLLSLGHLMVSVLLLFRLFSLPHSRCQRRKIYWIKNPSLVVHLIEPYALCANDTNFISVSCVALFSHGKNVFSATIVVVFHWHPLFFSNHFSALDWALFTRVSSSGMASYEANYVRFR